MPQLNPPQVALADCPAGHLQHPVETRGAIFDKRRYRDALLSFGSPPVKYARALLFELPVG